MHDKEWRIRVRQVIKELLRRLRPIRQKIKLRQINLDRLRADLSSWGISTRVPLGLKSSLGVT